MSLIGDTSGRNIIYDDKGELVLRAGEKILSSSTDEAIFVKTVSTSNSKTLMGYTKEPNRLYITNQRLVFVRKPNPFEAARYNINPLGLGDAVVNALRARKLRRSGACEYVEIPLRSIRQVTIRKGKYATLSVIDGSDFYEVQLDRKKSNDSKLKLLWRLWEKATMDLTLPGQYSLIDYS